MQLERMNLLVDLVLHFGCLFLFDLAMVLKLKDLLILVNEHEVLGPPQLD